MTDTPKPPRSGANEVTLPKGLIGLYKFDRNAEDSQGISGAFELKNAKVFEGLLYLNGCYEYTSSGKGNRVVAKIDKLDCNAFTICFDFMPLTFGTTDGERRNKFTGCSDIRFAMGIFSCRGTAGNYGGRGGSPRG